MADPVLLSAPEAPLPCDIPLLPFQLALLDDLVQEDGVAVLASGLGLAQIAAALIRLQHARRATDPTQTGALLVLGATQWQREGIRHEVARQECEVAAGVAAGAVPSPTVPEITAQVPAAERGVLYAAAPCLFVTTRILVVDFLGGRLAGRDLAGLLILNAHRVSDACGEAFAARLFRATNRAGSVRGLTDAAPALAADFNRAEKVLKALFVRRVHLWPRFQSQVRADLETAPPEVTEVSQGLTVGMAAMYDALAQLMDACVKEVRKSNKIDATDLTLEQGLFRSFDDIIRRQLNPIWHTVGPRTKQIVADLRTLRTLATYLLRFDAVTFFSYLETLRATEGTNSVWLFHSAAHTIFEVAKSRVYSVARGLTPAKRGSDAGQAPGSRPATVTVTPVLEPQPKWALLLDLLLEAAQEGAAEGGEVGREDAAGTGNTSSLDGAAGPTVLVACQDAFTASQLREVLTRGADAHMQHMWREYLAQRAASGRPAQDQHGGRPDPGSNMGSARMMGGMPAGEAAALAAAAKHGAGVDPAATGQNPSKRRGKGELERRGARAPENLARSLAVRVTRGSFDVAEAGPESLEAAGGDEDEDAVPPGTESERQPRASGEGVVSGAALADLPGFPPGARGRVDFLVLEEHDERLVWERAPGSVIMYDPDVVLTRQLELYNAMQTRAGAPPLHVFVLRYEESVEMDRFQAGLERERRAFESLIRSKEVGDYVLSASCCVERKAIPDLRASLASGRLFAQAEAMARHYATPVLLIEFEGDRAFALQAAGEVGDEPRLHSLMARLVLLTLHHPRLRLVWSRSLHATAATFAALKANQEEPDPVAAATAGVPLEAGEGAMADRETLVNRPAMDVLRRLPGVTEGNLRPLMRAGGSLAGLAKLSEAELAEAMGGAVAARKLKSFLAQDCRALFRML
ncbi:DNA repair endonuclease UVH1 [Auxenochlorella protothecoides]|uniref:DNA repair endonuclease UVH1 n=1 Tax=Auxenochlorella protothecoides TaxID=3075 RepID=A0A087SPF6_AUXPR|nr:DNA repair endonuclease UVH1 [Auxenochlorella protothecoides]KFM27610.1 DNA repair endonuclease UVH1 [Auxenochlorella protothecoides]